MTHGKEYNLRFSIDGGNESVVGIAEVEGGLSLLPLPVSFLPRIIEAAPTRVEVFAGDIMVGTFYMDTFEREFGPIRAICGFPAK